MHRVLVCGGRNYCDREAIATALTAFHRQTMPIGILIHGNAQGADRLAGQWAQGQGIHTAAVSALWEVYSRAAGHRRNEAMRWLFPDYCIAFPGGNGTANMTRQCIDAGIPVWEPYA